LLHRQIKTVPEQVENIYVYGPAFELCGPRLGHDIADVLSRKTFQDPMLGRLHSLRALQFPQASFFTNGCRLRWGEKNQTLVVLSLEQRLLHHHNDST
jgi:hypothetical protein